MIILIIITNISCHNNIKTSTFKSLSQLIDVTESTGKPALLYISRDGCDMCDVFEVKTLTDPNLIKYINNEFVFYKINSSRNTILNKVGYMFSFPMFVIIDGKEMKLMIQAVKDPEKLILNLKNHRQQPFEYNLALFTKLNGDINDIASSINCTIESIYHIEKNDIPTEDIISKLENSTDNYGYFYNKYLLAELYDKQGKKEEATNLYKELALTLVPMENVIYQSELPKLLSHKHDIDEATLSEITFDSTTHDFGEIRNQHVYPHKFAFKNTSNKPLLIYHVSSSCGCAVTDYPKNPILPGHTEYITVNFSASSEGVFNKSILVISNTSKRQTQLIIRGNVI